MASSTFVTIYMLSVRHPMYRADMFPQIRLPCSSMPRTQFYTSSHKPEPVHSKIHCGSRGPQSPEVAGDLLFQTPESKTKPDEMGNGKWGWGQGQGHAVFTPDW